MGEDLKRCNLKFRELMERMKNKRLMSKEEESLAYFFFMAGVSFATGMSQVIQ